MKKVLVVLGLTAMLGLSLPVNAAPQDGSGFIPEGGVHGAPAPRADIQPPMPREHYKKGHAFAGGVLARRGDWSGRNGTDHKLNRKDNLGIRNGADSRLSRNDNHRDRNGTEHKLSRNDNLGSSMQSAYRGTSPDQGNQGKAAAPQTKPQARN